MTKRQGGLKFRRQHPIERFVIDLYCPAVRLSVEVDGGIHEDPDQVERDRERSRHLAAAGLRVVRVSNADRLSDLEGVLGRIRDAADQAGAERVSDVPPTLVSG